MKINLNRRLTACLLLLAVFSSVIYQSCKKGDHTAGVKEHVITEDVKQQIKSLGFSTRDIRSTTGGYIVEGDIFLSYMALNHATTFSKLRVANNEQYRTTNLITRLPRVITLSVSNLPPVYSAATDIAIARYNTLGLGLTFQRLSSGAQVDIQYASLGSGVLGLSAGFPDGNGNPPSPIKLNADANALGNNPDQNYLATVIAHEIGHTIGFRHTDYFNRTISCGYGGNEGDAGVGAIDIPGTPTGADSDSWMLACIGNSANRPFTFNDATALSYLYQGRSSGEVIGVAVLPNGSILAVGRNYKLFTRTTLNSGWVGTPNNAGEVKAITVMQDGTILAIGKDGKLYTKPNINNTWVGVSNTGGEVKAVTIMQDGTILAVGLDGKLYTRATLNSSLAGAPNNAGEVKAVTIMQDGTILAVGLDNQLYTKPNLYSSWAGAPNLGGEVQAVTVLSNGTILAVGLDYHLFTKATLNSPWVGVY